MRYRICLVFAMLACLGLPGCAFNNSLVKNSLRPSSKSSSQWDLFSKLSKKDEEPESKPPLSMAAIWKDSVFEKPGTAPVRGFGARIFFYDEDNQAVKADGELIVYGFDDSVKNRQDSSKADRKYVFKADKFQSHFSETDLGASYSVWIPWEKIGGFRKTITLIPVFKTSDGRILKSGHSINVLPGKNPHADSTITKPAVRKLRKPAAPKNGIVTADFETASKEVGADIQQAAHENDAEYNKIRTSTIKLTPNLASKLSQPVRKPDLNSKLTNKASGQQQLAKDLESLLLANQNQALLTNKTSENDSTASHGAEESRKSPRVFGAPGSFR